MVQVTVDDGFLDLIYGTAIDSGLWPEVLRRVSDGMGGDASALVWYDLLTNAPHGTIFTGVEQDFVDQFSAYYAGINPLRRPPTEVRRILPNWTPTIVLDEDCLPKSEFLKTEFYNDFFHRSGFHSSASIGLRIEGFDGGIVDVLRSRRRGEFTQAELGFARQAQPHLIRAFRLNRQLAASGDAGLETIGAFQRSSNAVFILHRDGRVRRMNDAGETLVRAGTVVRLAGGRLTIATLEAQRRFVTLLGRAVSTAPDERTAGFMTIQSSGDLLPLSVSITPLPASGHPVFDRPSVMVRISDPTRTDSPAPEILREAFRLTPTETKVALALFEGLQTGEVAEHLGASVNTVRNHLAHILEKTRSSGQAELSRRLMNLL